MSIRTESIQQQKPAVSKFLRTVRNEGYLSSKRAQEITPISRDNSKNPQVRDSAEKPDLRKSSSWMKPQASRFSNNADIRLGTSLSATKESKQARESCKADHSEKKTYFEFSRKFTTYSTRTSTINSTNLVEKTEKIEKESGKKTVLTQTSIHAKCTGSNDSLKQKDTMGPQLRQASYPQVTCCSLDPVDSETEEDY
jgi:hypothetical protein